MMVVVERDFGGSVVRRPDDAVPGAAAGLELVAVGAQTDVKTAK